MTRRLNAPMLVCALLAGGFAFTGCQSQGDSARAELRQRELSWQRQLEGLRAQHAVLIQRFRTRTVTPGTDAAVTGPTRMGAILDGIAQSLVDVDIQIRQIPPRVERAIGEGGDAIDKALADESARMRETFQAVETDLVSAAKELEMSGRLARAGDDQRP